MSKKSKYEELTIEKLRWKCDPNSLKLDSTEDIEACEGIIGQDRAIRALRLGLDIKSMGYNIFVTGLVGTGRTTTIKHLLEKLEKGEKTPDDKCYVNNFKNSDLPKVISLPAGKGVVFKKDMDDLVSILAKDITGIFESEVYQRRKKEVISSYQERQKKLVGEFEKKVAKEGFALVQVQLGPFVKPDLEPLIENKPVPIGKLERLVEEGKFSQEHLNSINEKYSELGEEMEKVFRETRAVSKELEQALYNLDKEIISPLVKEHIQEIRTKYEGNKKIEEYLNEVQEDILSEYEKFREKKEEQPEGSLPGLPLLQPEEPFREYEVNVLIDNSETRGIPIIIETSPSYRNLFGTIERSVDRLGAGRADFTKIRAGSFLRANGGYLVLNALDAVVEPGVWQALKRTLRNGIVEIQTYDPFYFFSASALKPEAIKSEVKVVMIGDPYIYQTLYNMDDDFRKVFKIKADFDLVMPKRDDTIWEYATFIRKVCRDENLNHFDKGAVASVVEYGVRLAGRQNKLSTRFNVVADLIRESNYWATTLNAKMVTTEHVEKAIEEWKRRVNLPEDKIQEMIDEGVIMVDTQGKVVGQVNGLSIYDLGEYMFGKPTRITSRTSVGRAGVINIEREAELSGRTHNKGVLILTGFLQGRYAQDKPLVMNASICFEQSYSGVDGDSASSTEIYGILSSLSELPIRQDTAVTGSVNQKGEIQPIGGVNQKIEGFYDVCQAKGLTGTQGVIIPYQNIEDLMLRPDVVKSVEEGKFHIYPIKTIDEGIEILTEVKAGARKEDGNFDEGTVNYLVDKKLKEFAAKWREFSAEK
ncbi:MAG TPA: ATP-binding protein [Terriglobales bacterium]|nr:ATP-binding protein [Terriglobales bacterium]